MFSSSSSPEYGSSIASDNDDFASDGSSFHETELSPTQLVDSTEHFAIWELLHGCQEAAFEDVPLKYEDCLAVFNVNTESCLADTVAYQSDSQYEALFKLAGAAKTTDPWSLPYPIHELPADEAISPLNMQILAVSHVQPTAACFIALDKGYNLHQPLNKQCQPINSKIFHENASPLVHPQQPVIASAVFLSADTFGHNKPSFNVMWRYNRLATTSLLREACSLQIDVPVLGILLRGNLAAIHIDWYEKIAEDMLQQFNSAFISSQPQEMDIRIWDLSQPLEAHAFASILLNLRRYTSGPFATAVYNSLGSPSSVKPWKWNKSALPSLVPTVHLNGCPEMQYKDKVMCWNNGLPSELSYSSDQSWAKQKPEVWEVGLGTPILSPPSTPPGDN